jgi:hypothetical protein
VTQSAGRKLLTYLVAALAGTAGALLGWLLVGFLADVLLGLSGMSDREGYRAMVAFFTYGPFGAIAGLVLGLSLVFRYFGGYRSLAAIAGRSALTIVGIAGATALGLWAYMLSDDVLVRNGPSPRVMFELRFPADAVLPDKLAGVSVDLNTDKNTMPAVLTEVHHEQGRPLVSGLVELYFRTKSRLLVLRIEGEPDRIFTLSLAANPSASAEFGTWQRVDYVADGPNGKPRKATAGDDYEIRYRVERAD